MIFVLYPMKMDLERHTSVFRSLLARLKGRAEVFDLTPFWSTDAYRDAIRPTSAAEPKLADIIG